jgi:hypothetical protein
MSLDFSWDEEKPKFEKIPAGVYTTAITSVMVDTTRETAKLCWEFQVIGGDHDKRKIWFNQNVTPKAKYFINRNFQPFGQKANSPQEISDIAGKLLNEKCEINLTYRPWTNPTTNETKDYPQVEINNWLANFDGDMKAKLDDSQIPF